MNPMDNSGAPVIPAGTKQTGGVAYDPLQASRQAQSGQAQPAPVVPSQAPTTAPDGTTFAEIAAKKGFQTPDDLAKAYANLESHNKKVEMTAADIIKEIYGPAPAQVVQPQVPAQPVVPTVVATPAKPGEEQAIKIVQGIVDAQTKPLKEQLELQNLFIRNPDAKDYAQGLAQVVKENPGISWDNALKIAKFNDLEAKAKEQGRNEAYQTIQQKQSVIAGTASPSQGRAGPDVRSIIKDRNVPFKEVDRMVREYLTTQGQ